jgi:flagella basal body P-ring formation protein FlgA
MRPYRHRLVLPLLIGLAVSACSLYARADVVELDPDQLNQVVQARVAEALAPVANPTAPPVITVGAPRHDHLPACADPVAFLPTGSRLRSSMNVGVRCAAPEVWTTYVPVTVAMSVTYLVAAHSIDAQQVISEADLRVETCDLNRLPAGAVQNPALLLGRIAERRINAGRPLRTDALRDPQAVVRGQQVRVTAIGQGFSVTGEGEVLANASPGANVQVRTSSGQTVTGIVRNASQVEVLL